MIALCRWLYWGTSVFVRCSVRTHARTLCEYMQIVDTMMSCVCLPFWLLVWRNGSCSDCILMSAFMGGAVYVILSSDKEQCNEGNFRWKSRILILWTKSSIEITYLKRISWKRQLSCFCYSRWWKWVKNIAIDEKKVPWDWWRSKPWQGNVYVMYVRHVQY
jgi:hypothetical protein